MFYVTICGRVVYGIAIVLAAGPYFTPGPCTIWSSKTADGVNSI